MLYLNICWIIGNDISLCVYIINSFYWEIQVIFIFQKIKNCENLNFFLVHMYFSEFFLNFDNNTIKFFKLLYFLNFKLLLYLKFIPFRFNLTFINKDTIFKNTYFIFFLFFFWRFLTLFKLEYAYILLFIWFLFLLEL